MAARSAHIDQRFTANQLKDADILVIAGAAVGTRMRRWRILPQDRNDARRASLERLLNG